MWTRSIKCSKHRSNNRYFCTPTQEVKYRSVKDIFLKNSYGTSLAKKITVITGVAVSLYYLIYDWDNNPVRQLDAAINMLKNKDNNIKKDGFLEINERLYVSKRTFSGPVGTPVTLSELGNEELINVLIGDTASSDSDVSFNALMWLLKLSTARGKANRSTEVQSAILGSPQGLNSIISKLITSDYDNSKDWLLASALLYNVASNVKLSKYAEIGQALTSLAQSGNPLALSAAYLLSSTDPELVNSVSDESVRASIVKNLSSENRELNQIFLFREVNSIPDLDRHEQIITHDVNPKASIPSIIAFSAFGALWSKLRWSFRSRTSSSFSELTKTSDASHTRALRRQFVKTRFTGRALLVLFLMDYILSYAQTHASGRTFAFDEEFSQFPANVVSADFPMSSALPVIQTTLFTLGASVLLHYQRFVVVPIVAALLYNHSDVSSKVSDKLSPTIRSITRSVNE
eukprot:TRINITY_DN501_c0_g1_i1.p1 TRINITY_DN501_c0_g1~~TRINITY_DN501_c0_g1_i1.p1  ORF type:complete len:460 (-),score=52.24 TRINITY_DN501_c0_g1_i1:1511-2890(-)